jgi:hypothetical protein
VGPGVVRIGALALLGSLAAGCGDRRPPLASCADDLRGVYVADGGRRWMILDQRATLEVYPLFDDVTPVVATAAAAGREPLELGPRVLELSRQLRDTDDPTDPTDPTALASAGAGSSTASSTGIAGHLRRRYMRGTQVCVAKVPMRITACAGDALDVVLAEAEPPLAWSPSCTWPRTAGSRRERWIRE